MTPASTFMTDDPNVVTHRWQRTGARTVGIGSWIVFTSFHRSGFLISSRLPIRSFEAFAYDPAGRRLEIRYRWKSAVQFSPVTPGMFQEINGRANAFGLLEQWIRERRVSWNEVRTKNQYRQVLRLRASVNRTEGER